MNGASDLSAESSKPAEASAAFPVGELAPPLTPADATLRLPPDLTQRPLGSSGGELELPSLQPGELLMGRFTILRFIALGGMGAVYEANDTVLRTRVALKVLRGHNVIDADAMERFRREVLLARRVTHSNVCRVYELYTATTSAGHPVHFLTMELLEGETLSQRIARQGRLTTEAALPLVRQLCWGLSAAHAAGVVHRDFKSSNVILVDGGPGAVASTSACLRAVITDFGIARAAQLSTEGKTEQLTGTAGIVGTPAYMAPEQVSGSAVTACADIYALGVVMYEMVTGTLPFTGDRPLVVAAKRLNEAPPRPETSTPGLDPRWSAAVTRCLAREPGRRFQSALDILPALQRPLPRRWTLGIAVFLALACLAVTATRLFPNSRPLKPPNPVPTAHWWVTGKAPQDYQMGIDKEVTYGGKPSVYVKAMKAMPAGFSSLAQEFDPHTYRGMRMRFGAEVKSSEVATYAGLWMRVDGRDRSIISLDNMWKRPIRGTTDWKHYDVVLDVPESATNIAFGILLDGPGTVWMNDVKFDIVDTSIPTTAQRPAQATVELDVTPR